MVLLGGGLALGGYRSGSSYGPVIRGAVLATLGGAALIIGEAIAVGQAFRLSRELRRLGLRPLVAAPIVATSLLSVGGMKAKVLCNSFYMRCLLRNSDRPRRYERVRFAERVADRADVFVVRYEPDGRLR